MRSLARTSPLLGALLVAGVLRVQAIINGLDVEPHQHKYMIAFRNSTQHLCGGGLVTEQHVVTAAHCVILDDVYFRHFDDLEIIAGVDNLNDVDSPTRVVSQIEKIYVTDRYNHSHWANASSPYDDIAVIKLKTKLDIKGNPGLSVLQLPKKDNETNEFPSYENSTFALAGYGYDYIELRKNKNGDDVEFGNSTGKLHSAHIMIVNNDVCAEVYPVHVLETQLCGVMIDHENATSESSKAEGPCTGDSGSPLLDGDTLIGLVSSTSLGCNDHAAPGFYTKVSPFVDFVRNAIDDVVSDDIRVATWDSDENKVKRVVTNDV